MTNHLGGLGVLTIYANLWENEAMMVFRTNKYPALLVVADDIPSHIPSVQVVKYIYMYTQYICIYIYL